MGTIFRSFFFVLFIALGFSAAAQQPRRVLFETFTNSCDLCPAGNGMDAAFKQTLAGPNGSKVIHLNHHIVNVCDPMVVGNQASSIQEMIKLSDNAFPYPIFNGAVDHTTFSSTGLRITSMFDPSGSTEWNSRIGERVGDLPLCAITLSDIKLDRIGQSDYWRIIADVRVTLLDQNSDSLKLFYAITEDGIQYNQCQDFKPVTIKNHDNVVRYISTQGIPLDLVNKNSGSATVVTITHDISKKDSYNFQLANMQLIAFVERGSGGNYEVVQAWELQDNFDGLAAPEPSIVLSNLTLDGKVYAPEDNILISYDKTNVDSVKLEFSTDNGSTWQHIENINNNRYFWKAPDILTTQGKVRVSELKTGSPSVVSTGNFTIEMPFKRIQIIKPQGGDTAFLTKKLIIEWKKTGTEIIEKVDLDYSINGGSTWVILAKNQTGTTFTWNLFGPIPVTEQAHIRITEVIDSNVKVSVTSDPFYIMEVNPGKVLTRSTIVTDIRLYPQPVSSSSTLTVELTLDRADKLEFALYDMRGRAVYGEKSVQLSRGVQNHVLQMPSVACGSYMLTIRDSHGGQLSRLIETR